MRDAVEGESGSESERDRETEREQERGPIPICEEFSSVLYRFIQVLCLFHIEVI